MITLRKVVDLAYSSGVFDRTKDRDMAVVIIVMQILGSLAKQRPITQEESRHATMVFYQENPIVNQETIKAYLDREPSVLDIGIPCELLDVNQILSQEFLKSYERN